MKWSVERTITGAFGLTLAILSIMGGISYWNTTRLIETVRWVTHTHKVLEELEEVLANITIAESSGRGYIITGKKDYLEPSQAAINSLYRGIEDLRQLTQDNANQQRRLSILQPIVDRRLAVFTETIDSRRTGGFEAALKLVSTDKGKKLTAQIRALIEEMENEERFLLQKRSRAAAANARNVTLTVASGSILAFGLIPLASLVVNRDITKRRQAEAGLQTVNQELTSWINQLEQRNQEIKLLSETSEVLQACLTVDEAYKAIAYLLPPLFPHISGRIYIINASTNLVEAVSTWGNATTSNNLFGLDDCWALRRGRMHLMVDVNLSGLLCKHIQDSKPVEYCCVPMMAQGESLGILYLASEEVGQLTEVKQRLAVTVAEQVSLALANLKLREQLKTQSIQDPLTGLFNRRYLETTLERELERAKRNQQPLSLVMVDVDHFKSFNDTFGHEAGDAVLRELGQLLQQAIRGSDFACRYGGEELTIVMPGAALEVTVARAELLRQELRRLRLDYRGQSLGAISISLGVASFPMHGLTGDAVLRAADSALYVAKKSGRDRVEVAS